jgi:hypothetical protein
MEVLQIYSVLVALGGQLTFNWYIRRSPQSLATLTFLVLPSIAPAIAGHCSGHSPGIARSISERSNKDR